MTLATYTGGVFSAMDTNPPEASVDMLAEAKARAAWGSAVDALAESIPRIARINDQIQQLSAQGRWTGNLDKSVTSWVSSTEKLLGALVHVISTSPGAQNALDTQIAAVSGAQSVTQGAWREFVADLLPPAKPLSGLGVWQAAWTVMARVFSNPAVWNGAKELLVKMGPWVAATVISENVSDSLNTGAKQVKEKGVNLETCLQKMQTAESAADRAAIERLCSGANDPGSNTLGWLALGLTVGAVGLLYWQNRHRITVQSPVKLAGLQGNPRRRRYGQAW